MTDLKNGTLVLRWIHIVCFVLFQVFFMGGVYALTRYQVEDHERRLEKVEDSTNGIKELKEEIQRRLQHLEDQLETLNKLDIQILANAQKN